MFAVVIWCQLLELVNCYGAMLSFGYIFVWGVHVSCYRWCSKRQWSIVLPSRVIFKFFIAEPRAVPFVEPPVASQCTTHNDIHGDIVNP